MCLWRKIALYEERLGGAILLHDTVYAFYESYDIFGLQNKGRKWPNFYSIFEVLQIFFATFSNYYTRHLALHNFDAQ